MTWCWSEHQQQQHPRVVFGNWIQFCFNYFWIVISEDEPGNVFTIGNVCSFPKQRKYVRIWCEVIRTEHFCFKTYLDRSCCGLAEWKAVMLDWRLQQPHFITQLWQQQAAGGIWGRVESPLTVWQCGEDGGRDAAMTIHGEIIYKYSMIIQRKSFDPSSRQSLLGAPSLAWSR